MLEFVQDAGSQKACGGYPAGIASIGLGHITHSPNAFDKGSHASLDFALCAFICFADMRGNIGVQLLYLLIVEAVTHVPCRLKMITMADRSCNDSVGVPQKRAVGGIVDVRLAHRAVYPQFLGGDLTVALSCIEHDCVDLLPC